LDCCPTSTRYGRGSIYELGQFLKKLAFPGIFVLAQSIGRYIFVSWLLFSLPFGEQVLCHF